MAKPMKKEELRRPDGFVQSIESAAQWIKSHMRTFLIILALIVTVGVTVWVTEKNQNLQNKLAADAYFELMQNAPVTGPAVEKADWQTFLPQIQTFLEKHKASDMALPATMLLAKAYYATGEYEQALTVYKEASQKMDPSERYLAQEGVALSLQAQNQYDQSIEIFSTLAKDELNPLREMHTWYLVLAYQANQQSDKALETLQVFEKEFPNSPLMEKVKRELAMLEPTL